MYRNVFYFSHLNDIGGVETMLWHLARKYGEDHDIAVVYRSGAREQVERLKKLLRVHQLKGGERISCEKLFINYSTDILNHADAEEVFLIVHADYRALGVKPPTHPKINHYIGVSEHVCRVFTELTGKECELCYNPFIQTKPRKALHLITASRLTWEKGKKRMEAFGRALDAAGIPYVWTVYTNDTDAIDNPNILYRRPRLDILPYIAASDYLVQLSDTEGFSYTIQEALSVGTPVIVTPLPMCGEMGIVDGQTGFILPFDMSEIPVEAICKGLKKFRYTPRKDRWGELLAAGVDVEKKNDGVEVRVKTPYHDMQRGRDMASGEVVQETAERAAHIVGMGFAEYVDDEYSQ